jgi:hypothetical protein
MKLIQLLLGLSFAWAVIAMLLVVRAGAKLGLRRTHYTRLLSSSRPSDPAELFIWRGTLHFCCALLVALLCVFALVLIS